MNKLKMTSKEYFKGINMVFYTLISGILLFLIIALFINFTINFAIVDAAFYNTIILLFLAFMAVGMVGSQILFSNKLKKINVRNSDLLIKTAEYRSSLVSRFVLIEAPAFFSIVAYLLTGSSLFIIFVGVTIVTMFMLRPTKEKLINDLQLNSIEKEMIYDPNAIISEVVWSE